MSNNLIIRNFESLIKQIKRDIDDGINNKASNSFRLKNLERILNILKTYPKEIKNSNQLKNLTGISKSTLKKIDEILENKKLAEIRDIEPSNEEDIINDLSQVIGIGRKSAIKFIREYKIKSIDELLVAYSKGKIELNPVTLMGLKYHGKYFNNIPRNEIDIIKVYLSKIAESIDHDNIIEICGSYRRKKPTSNDIDVLFTNNKISNKKIVTRENNKMIEFVKILKDDKFIIDDLTYKDYETKYMGFCQMKFKNKTYPIRRIDIKFVPYNSFYAALLHFTGSNEFNIKIRKIAKNMGYKLNEYGLFKGKELIPTNSEKDIFDKLGLDYVPPEER